MKIGWLIGKSSFVIRNFRSNIRVSWDNQDTKGENNNDLAREWRYFICIKMKSISRKLVSLSLVGLVGVSLFTVSNQVSASAETQTTVSSKLRADYYKPRRIWITLGSSYDYGATHYFEYNGYRGYLSKVMREKVGKSATTLYRRYLYSYDVKSIPAPASVRKKVVLTSKLNEEK